jgi:glutathione S-transferase
MKIYGDMNSGNCLKVKYTADLLGLKYEWVPVDVTKGGSRSPEYLAKFPQGQVPGIELADGRTLAQSNAIIRYLAVGTHLLPDDPFTQAKIDEWLFWEQYSHEPYVAVCRYHMFYLGKSKESRDSNRVERGEKALDHMERQLENHAALAAPGFSIADIALFAYTNVAHQGGFDLSSRPNIQRWLGLVQRALLTAEKVEPQKDFGS